MKHIKEFLENLYYSGGKISSKRFYGGMLFVNAIVLSYTTKDPIIIKAFLYAGAIVMGIVGGEAVVKKFQEGKDNEK